MRQISTAMQTALAGGIGVVPVMFLRITFSDEPLRVFTGLMGQVAWDGQVWTGLGQVLQITPVAETSDGSPQQLTISLSPMTVNVDGEEDENLIVRLQALATRGAPVDLWLGFIATTDGSIVPDPLHLFSGKIDQRQVQDSGSEVELRLVAVSELEDGDRALRFRLSPARLAARGHDDDRFFDHLHEVEDVEIKWPGAGYWERVAG